MEGQLVHGLLTASGEPSLPGTGLRECMHTAVRTSLSQGAEGWGEVRGVQGGLLRQGQVQTEWKSTQHSLELWGWEMAASMPKGESPAFPKVEGKEEKVVSEVYCSVPTGV